MLIKGMMGLGDNIFARAFVKNYPGAFLETPWPELYSDLNVKCVRPRRAAHPGQEYRPSAQVAQGATIQRVAHCLRPRADHQGLRKAYRCEPKEFDLPEFGQSPVDGRYVLVRPATVRSEWRADARNPLPEYIASAAAEMQRRGWKVVSVADLVPDIEWALDPLPVADICFHRGELRLNSYSLFCSTQTP